MSRYWIYTFLCVLGFISCNNPNRKKIDSASAQQDSIVVRTIPVEVSDTAYRHVNQTFEMASYVILSNDVLLGEEERVRICKEHIYILDRTPKLVCFDMKGKVVFTIDNQELARFFKSKNKIMNIYNEGIIDKELCNSIIDGQIAKLRETKVKKKTPWYPTGIDNDIAYCSSILSHTKEEFQWQENQIEGRREPEPSASARMDDGRPDIPWAAIQGPESRCSGRYMEPHSGKSGRSWPSSPWRLIQGHIKSPAK